MKKVIGILVVVAFASSIASAELLKNVKYNGSVEVKSVTIGNLGASLSTSFDTDLKIKYSQTLPRVTLGINFDLNDDVNAQVTAVKIDRKYGDTSTTAGQTIDNITNKVMFSEAYLNLKNVIGINHKVGRQYYGKPGDIAMYYGPSSMNFATFVIAALDAWYGEWKKDKWTVTGLVGKVTESNSTTAMNDKDVYGVTAAYDYSEKVKPSVYIYVSDDRTAFPLTYKPNVAGVKAAGKHQGLGYGAEFAMNSGNNSAAVDYTGTAVKADLNYNFDGKAAGKFEFMGGFAMGSGDKSTTTAKDERFTAVRSNYIPGLLFCGVGVGATNGRSQVGLTNLTTFNFGANWTPEKLNKLSVGAKYYSFAYTEATDKPLGTELDFTAAWKHSDNVSARAFYALFTPDQKFVGKTGLVNNPTDAATLFGLDLVVKF
ncbi:MAG: alginate export family protein [Elusimicrobia bacterium]|nr:alginate export family protein [Elusimicrobiota bacterium]